jgi:hypothetical protein
MSTAANKGNQRIRWYYQIPLSASYMNQRLYQNLPAGIYSGFDMYIKSATAHQMDLSPGVIEIRDEENQVQIKCRTLEGVTVSATSAYPYIHAYWYWNPNDIDWYVDWVALDSAQGTSDVPASRYVCFGRARHDPDTGYITGFNFHDRQNASFPTTATDEDFREDVEDLISEILTAGPNIEIIYYDSLGILLISGSGTETGVDHGTLLNLLWPYDDHPQYWLTGGAANRWIWGNDWVVGEGRSISARGWGYPYMIIEDFYPAGVSFKEYIADKTDELLVAGENISIDYRDEPEDKIVISNPRDADDPAFNYASVQGSREYHFVVDPEEMGGNYWAVKQDVPIAVSGSAGFSIYGHMYSIGGATSATYADINMHPFVAQDTTRWADVNYQYNDVTNTWTGKSSIGAYSGDVRAGALGLSTTSAGWIVGGYTSAYQWSSHPGYTYAVDETLKYLSTTNSWTIKEDLTQRRTHLGGFSFGNHLFVVGGFTLATETAGDATSGFRGIEFYRYQDGSNSWSVLQAPTMSIPNISAAIEFSGFLIDYHYYFFGGRRNNDADPTGYPSGGPVDYMYKLDTTLLFHRVGFEEVLPAATFVYTLQGPPNPTRGGTGVYLNGFGYGIGGMDSDDDPTAMSFTDYNYEWDVSLRTWKTKASIPYSQGFGLTNELNGMSYTMQGTTASGTEMAAKNYQYRNVSMYQIPGELLKTTVDPFRIYAGVSVNQRTADLPVWITVDSGSAASGSLWLMGKANRRSFYKTGESIADVLSAGPDNYREYKMRVGLPRTLGLSARGVFVQKTDFSYSTWASEAFDLEGRGYVINGISASPFTSGQNFVDATSVYDSSTDYWTAKTPMGGDPGDLRRSNGIGFALHGCGYLHGGWRGHTTASNQAASGIHRYKRYDRATDFWSDILTYATEAQYGHAGFSMNGMGYVVAGFNAPGTITDACFKFDDSLLQFTQIAGPSGRGYPTGWTVGGYGYLGCGRLSANDGTILERYNDALDIWNLKTSDSPHAGSGSKEGCAGMSIQGKGIHVAGLGSSYTQKATEYNPVGDYWIQTSNPLFGAAYYANTCFVLNRQGFLIGGYNGSPSNPVYQLTLDYDPIEVSVNLLVI